MVKLSEEVNAAYVIARAFDDQLSASGEVYDGNIADAMFRIGDALNRIADAIERAYGHDPRA